MGEPPEGQQQNYKKTTRDFKPDFPGIPTVGRSSDKSGSSRIKRVRCGGRTNRGKRQPVENPFFLMESGGLDIFPHCSSFAFDLFHPRLDEIADRNKADDHAIIDHRQMPDAPPRHHPECLQ